METGNQGDLARRPGAAARMLVRARKLAGFTQRELAERAGVSQATVGRIESRAVQPKLETLLLLLNACGFELEVETRRGEGVDRTLIRQMLELTPAERIEHVTAGQRLLHKLDEARRAT